ncbi:hypothetical protein B0H14DRAFT_2677921 [Mycena olivaceomarginata]|nr:hypothetical protein B0H14DRAFT_2677921 [Mycena olivaceomarginata]
MNSNISSNLTFVINTQGPGPFSCRTFNINLQGTSLGSLANEAPITFTVNTDSDAQACPQRELPRKPGVSLDSHLENSWLRPRRPPHSTAMTRYRKYPKTSCPWFPLCDPKKKVKEANPGNSQRDSLADASDTEGDVTDFHNNEPAAVFSPNCILVSPSLKRPFDRMERDTEMDGTGDKKNALAPTPSKFKLQV